MRAPIPGTEPSGFYVTRFKSDGALDFTAYGSGAYVEGTSSLLDDATGLTVNTLQALLQMIDEKQKLLQLLNEYIDGPGLTVVIGAEHLDPSLRPFSLVLSTYDDGGAGIGTVGVLGPTRMRYSRAIAVVEGAAQAVSRVLKDPN